MAGERGNARAHERPQEILKARDRAPALAGGEGTRFAEDSGTRGPDAAVNKESPEIAPRPGDPAESFVMATLGPCPLCGAGVVEQVKSYGCSGWKQGCKFAVWKTIAGKAIGIRAAQSLLKTGHTPLLKGFQSKAGKPFDARLKLEGGEVRFDFGVSDRPKGPLIGPETV